MSDDGMIHSASVLLVLRQDQSGRLGRQMRQASVTEPWRSSTKAVSTRYRFARLLALVTQQSTNACLLLTTNSTI